MSGSQLITITVDDSSPLLRYTPQPVFNTNVSPDAYAAWSPVCNAQGGTSRCDDHSAHLTGLDGAKVALSFYGIGLEFYGNVTLGLRVQVTVDGNLLGDNSGLGNGDSNQNLLKKVDGLSLGQHTVVFTVQAGADRSLLTFDYAKVIVGHAKSFNRTVIDGNDEQSLTYGPPEQHLWSTWNNYDGAVVPDGVTNKTFRGSDKKGATIYKKFSGSTFLYYGPCYTDTGSYTIIIDGTANSQPLEYNASVPYQQVVQGCLRGYAGGLSTQTQHEILISNNQDQKWLTMNWLEIWDHELEESSGSGGGSGSTAGSSNGGGPSNSILSKAPHIFFLSPPSYIHQLAAKASEIIPWTPEHSDSPALMTSASPIADSMTAFASLAFYTFIFRQFLSVF
ncbi:hypothetical protein FRC20_002698 [Serendipita sp. 405]|nr:hypothetical protein FRC16_001721 [Serendipita sp. 398]KAG8868836.1 hypothetical protein FRC20_002698 [Serendipita sp. 405]